MLVLELVQHHIDNHNIQYKKIYDNLEKLINMKKNINNKVNSLEEKIKTQNETFPFDVFKYISLRLASFIDL